MVVFLITLKQQKRKLEGKKKTVKTNQKTTKD